MLKKIILNIFIYLTAFLIGYFFLIIFLGNDTNSTKDIELRKNFIVRQLSSNQEAEIFKNLPAQQAGEWELVSYSMAAYALTNVAMSKPETAIESSRIIENWINVCLGEKIRNFDEIAWGENPLAENVLVKDTGHIGYYGHLNLMLGAYALLNNDGKFKDLHQKISDAIERRMEKYPHHHVETYPFENYPPDNTVSVASLKISNLTLPKNYDRVIDKWIVESKKLEDQKSGLLPFQIDTLTGKPLQTFRGSHLGWNSFFLPLINEEYAKIQFERFSKNMLFSIPGIAGFKEYPKNVFFSADSDAGPIIFGLGSTATGFSIAGAKWSKDQRLYSSLLRSIEIFGVSITKNNERHYLSLPVISDAIILAMKTACPWKPLW